MRAYRLYFIGDDGHFKGVEVIEAVDDEAAITVAQTHIGACAMELWNLGTHVCSFPVQPNGQQPPLRSPSPSARR
jgi:hypothetical protein